MAGMARHGQEWQSEEHAAFYRQRAAGIPHRAEGEAVLLELLPSRLRRVLDIGTGDGRLLALIRDDRDGVEAVGLDFSPPMLTAARERFEGSAWIVDHDLAEPLPELGSFDAVVSSFAIHHLPDDRKRAIYFEVFGLLEPGGVFVNLEHVASPTRALREEFQIELGLGPEWEDPSNQLAPVEPQLEWLRAIGFDDVDCLWKWRELALLHGRKRA
jgi:tRNA (cmo5U34)-methyltransferase